MHFYLNRVSTFIRNFLQAYLHVFVQQVSINIVCQHKQMGTEGWPVRPEGECKFEAVNICSINAIYLIRCEFFNENIELYSYKICVSYMQIKYL